ncbi:hypothetical protein B0T22DRAFT_449005 [Podospora appendiculata]|uniref:BZIP domain-containing protein n=1 Tax=Podospora appendiculata TaxID=314037 RepID=A0AAE0XGS3_9PEZI|nr:hypothetical protein B0T22DRAFT_449005 [Podospora appendiculata]
MSHVGVLVSRLDLGKYIKQWNGGSIFSSIPGSTSNATPLLKLSQKAKSTLTTPKPTTNSTMNTNTNNNTDNTPPLGFQGEEWISLGDSDNTTFATGVYPDLDPDLYLAGLDYSGNPFMDISNQQQLHLQQPDPSFGQYPGVFDPHMSVSSGGAMSYPTATDATHLDDMDLANQDTASPGGPKKRNKRPPRQYSPEQLAKRREQNRKSQRAYRDRKDQRIKELEDQLAAAAQQTDMINSAIENLRSEYDSFRGGTPGPSTSGGFDNPNLAAGSGSGSESGHQWQ